MVYLMDRPRLGPYMLTRDLDAGPLGPRVLALHAVDSSSHVVHRLLNLNLPGPVLLPALEQARTLRAAHVLEIEEHGLDAEGVAYAVTPFTGDAKGLVTLDGLLRQKGGFLSPTESRQAVEQLLDAVDEAHRQGRRHGPISMSEVLVDRRGALVIELYGVRELAQPSSSHPAGSAATEAEEVRSVLRIGYRLVTGLVPDEPLIAAGRVVPGLERVWDDWFETGLMGGPGFKSAAHALSAIRDRSPLYAAQRSASRLGGALSRLFRS
ncbi:MAG: hypothetical protein ACT4PL_01620 [Phycisphaerales bacterium]